MSSPYQPYIAPVGGDKNVADVHIHKFPADDQTELLKQIRNGVSLIAVMLIIFGLALIITIVGSA